MSTKPTLAKGTRDFSPIQVAKRKYILNTIESVFKKYGFMPIETPAMENLTTLEGKYGDEGDQLLFRIINSGNPFDALKNKHGDSTLATYPFKVSELSEKGLRYDLTVPFARYVVMNRNEITFPFKRYQMQPVWRADRPQKGRYREFWQCDADVVGTDSLLCEIDLIQIYHEAFVKLGIPYEIKINNRKILAGIAEGIGAANSLIDFTISLDKMDKIGFDGVLADLKSKGFTDNQIDMLRDFLYVQQGSIEKEVADDFESTNNKILSFLTTTAFANNSDFNKGLSEIKTIVDTLVNIKKNVNLTIDLSLARGLSYYTGCILEVVAKVGSLKSSIGGGGRYDNLTGIFGMPNISGVGISFGLDRIYDVMEEQNLFPDTLNASSTRVLICAFDVASQQYGIQVLAKLRSAGIASEIYPDLKKISKQLDYANALKIPFAIIIGENEVNSQTVVLKNLLAGTQDTLSLETAVSHIQESII